MCARAQVLSRANIDSSSIILIVSYLGQVCLHILSSRHNDGASLAGPFKRPNLKVSWVGLPRKRTSNLILELQRGPLAAAKKIPLKKTESGPC